MTVRSDRVHDALSRDLDGGGDGTPGGNRVDSFFRLFGDTDGDGAVHLNDLDVFLDTYGRSLGDPAYLWYLDSNGDGTVNFPDWLAFRDRLPPF